MRLVLALAAAATMVGGALALYSSWRVQKWERAYPPAGATVEAGGISLHYIEEGEGRPVVFLHGGILSSYDFTDAVNIAARRGYRALAFDRPGYGYSERPRDEEATPLVQARLVRQALEALGVERPIFVAHSYSGSIAMAYALQFPEDLSGMVLVSAAVYGGSLYPAGYGDPLSRLVTTPIVGGILLNTLLVPLAPLVVPKMVEQTFAPDPAPQAYVEASVALWSRPKQFRANREDVLYFSPAMEGLESRFAEIAAPIVFVYGEQDPFGVERHAEKLSRTLPHVQTIVVPGAGHMLPEVHPEAVIDAIDALFIAMRNAGTAGAP